MADKPEDAVLAAVIVGTDEAIDDRDDDDVRVPRVEPAPSSVSEDEPVWKDGPTPKPRPAPEATFGLGLTTGELCRRNCLALNDQTRLGGLVFAGAPRFFVVFERLRAATPSDSSKEPAVGDSASRAGVRWPLSESSVYSRRSC
jgi:hypothetical protein